MGISVRPSHDDSPYDRSGYSPIRLATELIPAVVAVIGPLEFSPFWAVLFYFSLVAFGIAHQVSRPFFSTFLEFLWKFVLQHFLEICRVLKVWRDLSSVEHESSRAAKSNNSKDKAEDGRLLFHGIRPESINNGNLFWLLSRSISWPSGTASSAGSSPSVPAASSRGRRPSRSSLVHWDSSSACRWPPR